MADYNIQLHGPSTSTGSPSNDNLYPVTKAGIVLEVPTGSGTTDLASWATTVKVKKELIYSSTDTTVVPSSDINSYDHFEFTTGYGNFLAFLKSDGNIAGGTILIHGGQPYFVYGSANSSLSTINGFWTTMGSPGTSFTLSITAIYGIKY